MLQTVVHLFLHTFLFHHSLEIRTPRDSHRAVIMRVVDLCRHCSETDIVELCCARMRGSDTTVLLPWKNRVKVGLIKYVENQMDYSLKL